MGISTGLDESESDLTVRPIPIESFAVVPASALPRWAQVLITELEPVFLQAAHRLGAVGFLLALGTLALVYMRHDFKWVLAMGFLASDVGFCAGLVAWTIGQWDGRRAAEAYGAMIFNAIFLGLSLQLILLDRMDLIRNIANKFFSAG